MKQTILILCLFLSGSLWGVAQAQKQESNPLIVKTIQKIKFEEDTIESVFRWITSNIKYDVKKLKKITKTMGENKERARESLNERLADVLKTKKGVCQHYSELFDAIVSELGYTSFVVSGYTKKEDMEFDIDVSLGHAWNAIKVKGKWHLYDATWGAGGVRNERKFVRNYNPKWFDVKPEEMIKTHIPFDPIWQLLELPIPYVNFDMDLLMSPYEEDYGYEALIAEYLQKNKVEQMQGELERSEEMGHAEGIVKDWQKNRATFLENFEKFKAASIFSLEVKRTNAILSNIGKELQAFYEARKNGFKNTDWKESEVKQRLEGLKEQAEEALAAYKKIETQTADQRTLLNKNIGAAKKNIEILEQQLEWAELKFKN